MKTLLTLCFVFCLLITGCAKETKNPEPTPTPSQTENAQANTPSDAPTVPSSGAPAPQTAAPTPTPIPDERENLSKMYLDILGSNTYFMKAKIKTDTGIADFSVSVNGENIAQETYVDGVISSTVKKDGITYIVDHTSQMVITTASDVALSASNMAGEPIIVNGATLQTTATGDFIGESLYYEEYKTADENVLRFFFRDNALAGIECIKKGISVSYIIEEISENYREQMHVFPENYQILDMAAHGG